MVVTDDSGTNHDVLWWFGTSYPIPEPGIPIDLAYTLHTSTFRGERQLQIQLVGFRISEKPHKEANIKTQPIHIIDYRKEQNLVDCLKHIQAEHEVQVWIEGEEKSEVIGLSRNDLVYGKSLVVWTAPPNSTVWKNTLKFVKPRKLYLFAVNPDLDNPKLFLERLTGLVKFTIIAKDGFVQFKDLATKTGQPENTVKTGLAWLEAKGLIQIIKQQNSTMWIAQGNGKVSDNLIDIVQNLKSQLAESRAYRKYFQTTAMENLT
jgi:hypothetical protein